VIRVLNSISEKALHVFVPKANVQACGCADEWDECVWTGANWVVRHWRTNCQCVSTYTEVCVSSC
jgi:hypothetical protein